MALSRSPLRWLSVVLALALAVVAIMQFADFSGEPAPRWREIAMAILAPAVLCLLLYHVIQDARRAKED